ncbi:MAG: glycosyltransferase family 2 protein, partial [Stellaceae bacterium]
MLPPQVTVVIPCFNAARVLPAAVESVLAQGDVGVEILLVDDCSTDETPAIARSLASRHANITVLAHAANAGPGPARNTGLRHARSDFVCFLDADDAYLPGFFGAALRHFRANPKVSAVCTGIELVDCPHEVDPLHVAGAMNFMPSNKMLRRTTVEAIGGFPEDATFRTGMGGEDGAFFQVLQKYFLSLLDLTVYCRYHVGASSHFSRFVKRTRVENGKLIFLELEPIERSGALTAAILAFEKRFIDRCNALRDSMVFPELAGTFKA